MLIQFGLHRHVFFVLDKKVQEGERFVPTCGEGLSGFEGGTIVYLVDRTFFENRLTEFDYPYKRIENAVSSGECFVDRTASLSTGRLTAPDSALEIL